MEWMEIIATTVILIVVSTQRQGAMACEPSVTVLTDIQLSDHSALDKHFQTVTIPDITIAQWKEKIKSKQIQIKCPIVWLMVGNAQVPWDEAYSATSQMKKLILAIVAHSGRKLRQIVVGGAMPRPDGDNEVLLGHEIRLLNLAFQSAVKEAGKARNFLRKTKVMYVATQNLFLENYTYFDFTTGSQVTKARVIRPIEKNFVPGTPLLNPVGLYHVRSYVLKITGVLGPDVNSWEGMKHRVEPPSLQKEKRKAYLKAKRYAETGHIEEEETPASDGDDTAAEDEGGVPHVIHVQAGIHHRRVLEPGQSSVVSSTTDERSTSTSNDRPVYRRGRRVQPWDYNVDYDATEDVA